MATPKIKTTPTKRRQAWDAFKSGYDGNGPSDAGSYIKSRTGNAILGKDKPVSKTAPAQEKTPKQFEPAKPGQTKAQKKAQSMPDRLKKYLGYDPGNKPATPNALDQQLGTLKKELRPAQLNSGSKSLPAEKITKIQQALELGKANKDQYALAGRSILKYHNASYDVKQLAATWLAIGKTSLMQSKSSQEEGTIEQTFGTNTIDKHDKKQRDADYEEKLKKLRKLAGISA